MRVNIHNIQLISQIFFFLIILRKFREFNFTDSIEISQKLILTETKRNFIPLSYTEVLWIGLFLWRKFNYITQHIQLTLLFMNTLIWIKNLVVKPFELEYNLSLSPERFITEYFFSHFLLIKYIILKFVNNSK